MRFKTKTQGTLTRRAILRSTACIPAALVASACSVEGFNAADSIQPMAGDSGAPLHTLYQNRKPHTASFVWGAPWKRGQLKSLEGLILKSETGASPLQSWPLAYWPDGSFKFTGHSAIAPSRGSFSIEKGKTPKIQKPVTLTHNNHVITVSSGEMGLTITKSGVNLIDSISRNNQEILKNVRLSASYEDSPEWANAKDPSRILVSQVNSVLVELFAQTNEIKMVHTLLYDLDHETQFLSSLGLTFDQPMYDELHNRHVRFTDSDGGVWSEAVRNIPGWSKHKFPYSDRFKDQIDGKKVETLSEMGSEAANQLATVPAFDEFRIQQLSATNYTISKRTGVNSSRLNPAHGKHASGLGYIGGPSGGVSFGLRSFRETFPSMLEITQATTDTAKVSLWMWPKTSAPMDTRHYSTKAHGLRLQYEDITEGFSTPYGIGRTHELSLRLHEVTPSAETLAELSTELENPQRIVPTAQRLHDCNVFGVWAPEDRSTPVKEILENQHDALISLYQNEIEDRGWLGFWNYGDVMHTYDADRHNWRYDVGGYAWANSELGPDLWLWYAYLRSGRPDIFRMAEAMTRHTGEVDVYHIGPLRGLGSRHNVSHWGGGAKEVRISQALYRRFYYYLTADERTGDLMREVADFADEAIARVDPLRKILPKGETPTHARSGPDWFALASNWMTEWERTGDEKWKDRIVRGLTDISNMPKGMLSGSFFGYDPATDKLTHIGGDLTGSYHLVSIMGGAEFIFELDDLIEHKKWSKAWLLFCISYNAPVEKRNALLGTSAKSKYFNYPIWHSRLTAFAGYKLQDEELSSNAWEEFLYGKQVEGGTTLPLKLETIAPPHVINTVKDTPIMSTNHVSQWALNFFQVMALADDQAPTCLKHHWADAAITNTLKLECR